MNGKMVIFKETTKTFSVVIFTVAGATEDQLKELMREMDSASGQRGAGSYSIQEQINGSFLIRELDREPAERAESGIIRIRENRILAPTYFFTGIYNQIAQYRLNPGLLWNSLSFQDAEAAKKAFERA